MAKPPADADAEKFIIGRGVYDNLRTARPYHDGRVFRIDPAPMPWRSMLVMNAVFVAFFFGFHWLTKHHAPGRPGPWLVYGVPIGVGLVTCGLFTAIVYHSFDRARRRGPWLIYDKRTGRVELPREGLRFERSEVEHIQYITTKRLNSGGVVNNDQLSELNLVTCRGGERRRWPLLRSIANVRAFEWIVHPLLDHTDLEVVRVKDQWLGWEVTERSLRESAGD
jgi:hypothetical protein